MKGFLPTSNENIGARLFLRYAALYASAVTIGVFLSMRGAFLFLIERTPMTAFLFIPLAAGAALLTVSNTYLFVLTVLKGIFDAQLLFRITLFVRGGSAGFWEWNGCFFLVAASLTLFLLAAMGAARFSFENHERDLILIFSKPFAKYLSEVLLLCALALIIYFIWPRLLSLLPLS